MASYDVAIIGGGPAGSTAGTILKKYAPELKVAIFERESFPRDHVGESQLPPVCSILDEMGCWDKVEAADFPIKVGATYRWGRSRELWDFEFLPPEEFKDEPRPARYEGQRLVTAFQVDRAIYDKILLDHAAEMGCEVREQCRVIRADCEGDRVTGLTLEDGTEVSARYYFDASGHSGFLRRALGVKVDSATSLQNIAIWDYWQNAEWAVEIGVGGTRIQVLSLGYGWLWFIPLGPTRTSLGLVVPADYYKQSGMKPDELYEKALGEDPLVANLIRGAQSEGKLQTTKDWSFVSERMVGENWFLIGESAGFADPILSAGLTIAQEAAREAAYTVLELDRGKLDPKWLREEFELRQSSQISRHIRFADYWYTANSQFKDLKEFTSKIASEAGLDLAPDKAWAWIAQGGFIEVDLNIGVSGFDLLTILDSKHYLSDLPTVSVLEDNNTFELDLSSASWKDGGLYLDGRITEQPRYVRGSKILPVSGVVEVLIGILQQDKRLPGILRRLEATARSLEAAGVSAEAALLASVPQTLQAMILDGWVKASFDPSIPMKATVSGRTQLRWNEDEREKDQKVGLSEV